MRSRAKLCGALLAVVVATAVLPVATASATLARSSVCKAYETEKAKEAKSSTTLDKDVESGNWVLIKKDLLAAFKGEASAEREFAGYLSGASAKVKAAAAVTPSRFIVAPAATRGRIATEGGDVRGGVKRALSVRAPASRTGSNCGNLDALGGHSTAEARAPSRLRRSYHEFVAARVLCSRPRHR